MNNSGQRSEIWWFEPRWSYLPEVKRATNFVEQRRFWFGGVLAPYAAYLVLVVVLGSLFPDVMDEWERLLIGGALAILFLIWLLRYGVGLIPPLVVVNKRGVYCGGRLIVHDRIRRLVVDLRGGLNTVLRVETEYVERKPSVAPLARRMTRLITLQAPKANWRIGISERISPAELVEFLHRTFPDITTETIS